MTINCPELSRYRVLVLAGCVAMSKAQIDQVNRFVQAGGRLCLVGPAAQYDEWLQPRTGAAFAELPTDRVMQLDDKGDAAAAVLKLLGDDLSIAVDTEPAVCMELTRQNSRRLVHLVNYRPERPVHNVGVRLKLPADAKVAEVTVAAPQSQADESVPFTLEAGVLKFQVPRLDVYAIAVVE